MKKLIFIVVPFIFACSSTINGKTDVEGTDCNNEKEIICIIDECEGTQTCEPDGFWGECFCKSSTGGSSNTGGSESTGGSDNTGGSNTGGMEGNTGGANTNTGGVLETGGTNGTGGSMCTPKTCADFTDGEIGSTCGVFDDGCGQMLECNCLLGTNDCGAPTPQNSTNDNPQFFPGEPGVCGGGCIEITPLEIIESNCNDTQKLYSCYIKYEESTVNTILGMDCHITSSFQGSMQGYCCE